MSIRPGTKSIVSRHRIATGRNEQDTSPLTRREAEIMGWVSEGKRDREIAIILGVSPRTVEKHVANILQKLQAETRTAAVKVSRLSQNFDRES